MANNNNNETELAKEEQDILDQRVRDLASLANTPAGARIFKSKLISFMHPGTPLFTGNSGTFYNLGMNAGINTELEELVSALELRNFLELGIYLEKRV